MILNQTAGKSRCKYGDLGGLNAQTTYSLPSTATSAAFGVPMNVYSYIDSNQFANVGLLVKGGLDMPSFLIDWNDGLADGSTISSVTVAALSSTGATITSACISSTSTSGAQTLVLLATCGAGGTAAAVDGNRMRLEALATLSNAAVLAFDVFCYIANPNYSPT